MLEAARSATTTITAVDTVTATDKRAASLITTAASGMKLERRGPSGEGRKRTTRTSPPESVIQERQQVQLIRVELRVQTVLV